MPARTAIDGNLVRLEVLDPERHAVSLFTSSHVPDAADLVVTDPVQAGVMAVMTVADTAKFDLQRQLKRRY